MLRLARRPDLAAAVERERLALEAARSSGAPAPAVYERVDVDGRPGLILERVVGHDLLVGLLIRPWELMVVPWVLARAQTALHEVPAPTELPELRAELARCLSSPLVPAQVRAAALQALEQLPDGDRLLHGDLHPGNILRRSGGRWPLSWGGSEHRGQARYVLIDWKGATRGDPAADVARTRLLLMGAWIPGLGPRWAQLPLRPFTAALYWAYRLLYRRRRRLERGAVRAWIPVLAAARLFEDISQERRRLLRIARRGLPGA